MLARVLGDVNGWVGTRRVPASVPFVELDGWIVCHKCQFPPLPPLYLSPSRFVNKAEETCVFFLSVPFSFGSFPLPPSRGEGRKKVEVEESGEKGINVGGNRVI